MSQDTALFIGSIVLLIVYLVFSAKTEMGTQWPWQKESENRAKRGQK